MANTLGGINLAAMADETIKFLGSEFFPVNLFSTNFTKDIAQRGESVTTRIVSSLTAQDVSSSYSSAAQDVTSTAVTTTLSNFKGHVAKFTDLEISKAGDAQWLMNHWMEPTREATMKALIDDLLALITNANYSNKTTKAVGVFDADVVADIAGALTTRKVSQKHRALLLDPTYYTALSKDSSVHDLSAYGNSDAIKDGVLSRVRGFNVHQYEAIPGNSENLKGFAVGKSSLVIAVRPVYKPEIQHVAVENRIEPNTGLPFQFRFWYDPSGGNTYMSAGFLYGVSVGDANALQRIVSA
jgi:hypothetical protein